MSPRVWLLSLVCMSGIARAQPADPWTAPTAPDADSDDTAKPASEGPKLGGYVEMYDAWNFNEPANGVTNLRGFDFRHASLTLQNAVLDATWKKGPVSGRAALQFGDEPDAYYQAEPSQPATGTAPASTASEWRHIQEAWAAWMPCDQLELAGGLFLSPIGPEVVQTKDNWNWSRSNLFFMLPYFHAGVRAKHALGDSGLSVIGAVYNGWNNAVDENRSPAFDAIVAYQKGDWTAQVQYFAGIQRRDGGPDVQHWRHLFDAYVQGPVPGIDHLSFIVHGDGGFERAAPGATDRPQWIAGAAYLKYDVTPRVFIAARGDAFREWRPVGVSPIFLPSGIAWISSGTATVSWRPVDGIDLRAEYRHDSASDAAYFKGDVFTDTTTGLAIANATSQDTVTGGFIAWF